MGLDGLGNHDETSCVKPTLPGHPSTVEVWAPCSRQPKGLPAGSRCVVPCGSGERLPDRGIKSRHPGGCARDAGAILAICNARRILASLQDAISFLPVVRGYRSWARSTPGYQLASLRVARQSHPQEKCQNSTAGRRPAHRRHRSLAWIVAFLFSSFFVFFGHLCCQSLMLS